MYCIYWENKTNGQTGTWRRRGEERGRDGNYFCLFVTARTLGVGIVLPQDWQQRFSTQGPSDLSANMLLQEAACRGSGEMSRRIKLPNYPLFVAADFKKPWHCPLIAINLAMPWKRRQYCISGGCGASRSITPVRTCRHVNIYLDASRGAKEISIYLLARVQEGAQPQLAEITT